MSFFRRTLPPTAAPICFKDVISGLKGPFGGQGELDRFGSELKDFFHAEYCFLVSSGKAALTLILQALKALHPDRDEVLIPAFTCYSVPSAVVRAGLKVKLCDIDPNTLDFDFEQLSAILDAGQRTTDHGPWTTDDGRLTMDHGRIRHEPREAHNPQPETRNPQPETRNPQPETRNPKLETRNPQRPRLLAVIPTHLFGLPADVDRLRACIDDSDLTIIEDAAQVMGAEWNGKKLGTLGDVSFFSLGRGKALSTVQGGIILTNRKDIGEKLETQLAKLRGNGFSGTAKIALMALTLSVFTRPTLFWAPKSLPFLKLGETIYNPNFKIRKMSPLQAGLAGTWQQKLSEFQRIRSRNTAFWSAFFHAVCNPQPATRNSQHATRNSQPVTRNSQPDLTTDHEPRTTYHGQRPFLRFPLMIRDDAQRASLLKKGEPLGIMPTYPDSINGIPELKAELDGQPFPAAKQSAHQLITLPIHPLVSEHDKGRIVDLLHDIFDAQPGWTKDNGPQFNL